MSAESQTRTLTLPTGGLWLSPTMRLVPVDIPSPMASNPLMSEQRAWVSMERLLSVAASFDDTPHGRLLHVSVAHRSRYPTWAELLAIRNKLFPSDIDVMMMLPRAEDYVNIHPNCFHLIQCPAPWGLQ